jgi:hypothetical protein
VPGGNYNRADTLASFDRIDAIVKNTNPLHRRARSDRLRLAAKIPSHGVGAWYAVAVSRPGIHEFFSCPGEFRPLIAGHRSR